MTPTTCNFGPWYMLIISLLLLIVSIYESVTIWVNPLAQLFAIEVLSKEIITYLEM